MQRFPFSNMFPFDVPMRYGDLTFSTPENFYQAMKVKDQELRRQLSLMKPNEAKKAVRKMPLRPDWNEVKLKVMRYALDYKFGPGTTWRQKLLDTGDSLIEEGNWWHDNYWGKCYCQILTSGATYGVKSSCKGGENHLGKMLMEIRDLIRQGKF